MKLKRTPSPPYPRMGEHLQSDKYWFNPVEWLKQRGIVECNYITYDPNVDAQYRIIRGVAHDGTMMFTEELIWTALLPMLDMKTYCKSDAPDWGQVEEIHYTVGDARLATAVGIVDLPCGRFPGERQRIAIPVRCRYVMRGAAP